MNLLQEDFKLLNDLGLTMHTFKADDFASHRFVIVTKSGNHDELFYSEHLSEDESDILKSWMRVGEPPRGACPKWFHIADDELNSGTKVYTYIAGESSEIDCTAVASDMFFEKDGQKYTRSYTRKGSTVVKHPEYVLKLSMALHV